MFHSHNRAHTHTRTFICLIFVYGVRITFRRTRVRNTLKGDVLFTVMDGFVATTRVRPMHGAPNNPSGRPQVSAHTQTRSVVRWSFESSSEGCERSVGWLAAGRSVG